MPAVIFDMDDTLVSTAALWRRAEERLLASIGATWTAELARQYKGMNALDVAATVHRVLRPAGVSVEECQRTVRGALLEEFCGELPGELKGAGACIKRMAAHCKVAVASGSPVEAVESVMAQLGVHGLLAVILSSESVARGKPAPDVFLAAAAKLGVTPGQCVVFEDSVIGVQAAVAAGMGCFAVPSGDAAAVAEIRALGARVVASLEEVGWADVERMIK